MRSGPRPPRSTRSHPVPSAAVPVACEAYLGGTYADLLEAGGEHVPVWAWVNLLAHGTEDQLRTAADALASEQGWRQARAFLAGEVLDAVGTGRTTLRALQDHVLVPLELDLVTCRGAERWRPAQLVAGLLQVVAPRRARAHG